MVKLYREQVSSMADTIEAELRDMTFGYEREILDPAGAARRFGPEHSLPLLTNYERVVSGGAIPAYLEELRTLIEDWRAFQSDSCYVNDKGETC